jgi:hypothetical protein
MLIPLGFLAGSGGGVDTDFELIETTIVSGSSTSSVVFSGLGSYSSIYKHLQLRAVVRSASAGADNIFMRLNADTGNNYKAHQLFGNGSSVSSATAGETNTFYTGLTNTGGEVANAFAPTIIDFLDVYATKNKTVRTLTGTMGSELNGVTLRSGLYLNTASLTSITCNAQSGVYAAGSRFSLYGIKG